jgi:hypothetical protein
MIQVTTSTTNGGNFTLIVSSWHPSTWETPDEEEPTAGSPVPAEPKEPRDGAGAAAEVPEEVET